MGTYFGPPTPAYNNPPTKPQSFKPSKFSVSNIQLGITTTVTTAQNDNYVIGQLVRLVIPSPYGCRQLNEVSAYVIGLPTANQIVLNVDSRSFDSFNATPTYGPTPPQIVAIGDVNTPNPSSQGRVSVALTIPGAFQNISPQ